MVFLTWKHMMSVIGTLSEEEIRESINYEVATYRRKHVISRLHQRYCKLKATRERELLLAGELLL